MNFALYLVRHATPDWSRTDLRYDVPPGPPLTGVGEAEAAKLGEFLRSVGVQKIYTSPLDRTRRTAEIAAEIAGVPVLESEAIAEWRRDESEAGVLDRCYTFCEAAWEECAETGAIALVTHGGPVRALLQHFGLDAAEITFYRKQFDRDNPLPPAGVWRLTRDSVDSEWKLELVFTPNPFQKYVPQVVYV